MFVSIPVWCDLELDLFFALSIPYQFQFQYGAIWSVTVPSLTLTFIVVSIPVWCDLEAALIPNSFNRSYVSIPVWCDLEMCPTWKRLSATGFNSSMVRFGAEHLQNMATSQWVSIPVWCDLESPDRKRYVTCDISFNSSMVRFGGWLRESGISLRNQVSIPVWCDLECEYESCCKLRV